MKLWLATLAALALWGCGEDKSNVAQNDKLLTDLDACTKERDKVKGQFDNCSKAVTELRANPPSAPDEEIVVRIEGDRLTVTGKVRGGGQVVDNSPLSESEKKAVRQIHVQIFATKSKIQQCYAQALKANVSLQNQPIDLDVTVTMNPNGTITNPRFDPSISAAFDSCMKTVATTWKGEPYQGKPRPVRATIALQPVR